MFTDSPFHREMVVQLIRQRALQSTLPSKVLPLQAYSRPPQHEEPNEETQANSDDTRNDAVVGDAPLVNHADEAAQTRQPAEHFPNTGHCRLQRGALASQRFTRFGCLRNDVIDGSVRGRQGGALTKQRVGCGCVCGGLRLFQVPEERSFFTPLPSSCQLLSEGGLEIVEHLTKPLRKSQKTKSQSQGDAKCHAASAVPCSAAARASP